MAWDYNQWRLGANFNYRGSMSNREDANAPCWSEGISLSGTAQIPGGCKIASFYTVDLFGSWKFGNRNGPGLAGSTPVSKGRCVAPR